VVNTGNVMLAGTQVVTVTGPFGAKSTLRAPALPAILPGDSIQYTVSAGGMYPAGSMTAHVTVTPGWPADATPLAVSLVSASASASTFAVPWALIVLIIVLAFGGYLLSRVLQRRRRAHQAEIAAAADRARRETERRLLGGSDSKSSAEAALTGGSSAKTKPTARPAPDGAGKPHEAAPDAVGQAVANTAAKPAPRPAANVAKPAEAAPTAPTSSLNGTAQHERG
jgi:hypothetical protein